ncbi:TetR/AcrR family transcriptional regulator [Phenylobacterium aquaticum]|uniref:TetR/AcrR family transcriptional regulator n=1 Tax=Phenylobacterium aquaticum TaxID=1763816 RepID=UPI0026EDFA70|nr:TetR/AcrR family transcriptional regulator [Phenylobacterium aquaticum]
MTLVATHHPSSQRSNRDRLVSEARRLFAEHGYAEVSVDEVAAAANLTKGAVYYQFKDKADLFHAACHAVMEDVVRQVDAAGRGAGTPRLEELMTGGRRMFDAYGTREAHRLLLIDGPSVLGFGPWLALQEPIGACLVADGLKHYAQAGMVPANQIDALSHLLFGAFVQGVLRIASAPPAERDQTERDVRAATGTLLRAFLRGLQQPETP